MSERRDSRAQAAPALAHRTVETFARALLPARVTLGDIAAALAKTNRFAGKTDPFYSVAQHSVVVAEQLADDATVALCGLLHDGHEIVTGDIPTNISDYVARYVRRVSRFPGGEPDPIAEIKAALDALIFPALGLPWPLPPQVLARIHLADQRAFKTELRDVALPLVYPHDVTAPALPMPIAQAWPWPKAEDKFIACFDRFAVLAGVPRAKRRAA